MSAVILRLQYLLQMVVIWRTKEQLSVERGYKSLKNKLLPNLDEASRACAYSLCLLSWSVLVVIALWLLHYLKETKAAASDKLLSVELGTGWRRHGAWLPVIYS